jgi:hypothetical protein
MNDVDKDVSSTLHRLIDHEPVDTERALREVVTKGPSRRAPRAPVMLAAAVVAVLAVAVFVPRGHPQPQRQLPPYKLVGTAGAEVVVDVDSSGQTPTAELTVGDTSVQGVEVQGHATESNGIALDEPFDPFSQPTVDVPGGSSLLVEGTFDSASASQVPWVVARDDGDGSIAVFRIGTWELDSSGGSVVFPDERDNTILVVDVMVGGLDHYFFFNAHVVPLGA